MGGATEHLLYALGIEMDVDEEEYMKEWKKERELKGAFHDFGKDRRRIYLVFHLITSKLCLFA